MSLVIPEDEYFALTANITSPGLQRIGLRGYLVRRTNNGTYVAPLIPQMFYGASGEQLTTWQQEFTETGEQVILSRSPGGNPKVPNEELRWMRVNGRTQSQTEVKAERLQEPNWGALALIALAIIILGSPG
jgi:hypothetical protein